MAPLSFITEQLMDVTQLDQLTAEDFLSVCKLPDGITRSNYDVDIHNSASTGTVLKQIPSGDYYEIPFGCLAPRVCRNLLIGSRCISATHEVHSSLRIMPVVWGIGEAAGIAAAFSLRRGIHPPDLDGSGVRQEIGI